MSLHEQSIDLLRQMVRIPSLSGQETDVAACIASFLESAGIRFERFNGNIVAVNRHFDPAKPTLALDAHLDTVPVNNGYTRDPYDSGNDPDIIYKLIEPPVKREGISAEKIEKAVRTADIPMILMIFVMIVFGLIVLYSVSGPDAYGQFQDSSWFLARQIRFTVAGIVMMLIVAFIPIEFFAQKWIAISAYAVSIGLAFATIALGVGREHGAARWINIGPIQLQSSEIIIHGTR